MIFPEQDRCGRVEMAAREENLDSSRYQSIKGNLESSVSNQLSLPHQAHGARVLASAPSKPWLAESGWHRARLVPANDPARRPKLLPAPGRQVAKSLSRRTGTAGQRYYR